ncbi:MAG: cytochrome c biogenesis protein CcsA, partial [Silvanigrellaceae bacterium]|nr:cytochrome c biogenesis protein CcsA [Silvanigrellaceae bacterium]
EQGNIYRILFVHVPVAWNAFFWLFIAAFFAVFSLISSEKSFQYDWSTQACIELGTLFSSLVLITGSIWGRPTWGVWWDWDPRLTCSLVMFLMGCGYLILRDFTPNPIQKKNMSAIIAILCAINVPIVYFSVNLWRSLHQPQTFIQPARTAAPLASSDISIVLSLNCIALFLFSLGLYKVRRQGISAQENLYRARRSCQL